ncbi:unnamed protein product [Ceratitis capitata]|uniref:(Mediterranean fruit fly) hypothetical protein n=1 Tax=Ceratitis capitata TaxID=7213 RepID=A0A811UP02_CERCA|nr:unnamed protein product [Ceratitis capitata]
MKLFIGLLLASVALGAVFGLPGIQLYFCVERGLYQVAAKERLASCVLDAFLECSRMLCFELWEILGSAAKPKLLRH